MKFNVGDKVKVNDPHSLLHGYIGVIDSYQVYRTRSGIPCDLIYRVKWDNGNRNRFETASLELVSSSLGPSEEDVQELRELCHATWGVPNTYFKVGDQVEVLKGKHRGKICFIRSEGFLDHNNVKCYTVATKMEDVWGGWYVEEDEIELVAVKNGKAQFKVGDKIILDRPSTKYDGKRCEVIDIHSDCYTILIKNGPTILCHEKEMNIELGQGKLPPAAMAVLDSAFENLERQQKCKLCGGEGRLLMLNNYVPCDCIASDTEE